MLTLRKEQVAVFSPLGEKAFEDRMIEHLKNFSSERYMSRSASKVRETTPYGT